jgi:hypothetical protein
MARKSSSVFIHPFNYFERHNIKSYSKENGLLYKDNLESHIWIYELHGQIQKRCGESCVLKGGASTQLHLPLNLQRLTNDIDCATDLTSKELFGVMKSIKDNYIRGRFYTSYEEYIPKFVKSGGRTVPMMTFIYDIPFQYKTKMRQTFPGLKLDFLFLDTKTLHKETLKTPETLGLKLKYNPICIDKYSTFSDKLLTLATSTLGLEAHKIDALYKNVYDLSCLLKVCNDLESFIIISERMKESYHHEIEVKNGMKVSIDTFFRDILDSLLYLSLTNMLTEYNKILPTLLWFGEQTLQEENRAVLNADLWSILCLYLYIWTYALMEYNSGEDYSKLYGLNSVLDQYDYYLSLQKKERRKHKNDLKTRILNKEPNLNISATGNPLRLMFLDYIFTSCPI